jgi:hypothetical protein
MVTFPNETLVESKSLQLEELSILLFLVNVVVVYAFIHMSSSEYV